MLGTKEQNIVHEHHAWGTHVMRTALLIARGIQAD